MITPPFLKPGDTIGLISTARKISREELTTSITIFESWGLNVLEAPGLYSTDNQYAGKDNERTAGMQQLLDDTNVKAIMCARGGYGTVRIIDKLDFTLFRQSPKWIIGYSDITILHQHIQKNFGIESLHATMPVNFNQSSPDSVLAIKSLQRTLFGETANYTLPGNPFNRKGIAKGELTGGNLSIIYSLIGSQSDIETEGKILFLEDIDEYLYHIDRMMMSLKRSGKLDSLAGLMVGGFTDMKDNETPFGKTAEEIISESVKDYRFPILFGFPAGHQALNMPLIMGREVTLEVGEESALRFSEPIAGKGFRKYRNMIKPVLFIMGGFVVLYILYSLLLGRL